jgi:hypothetical protein
MRRLLILFCLLVLPLASALANGSSDHYLALVSAAKTSGASIDWHALRFAYAESPGFDPQDLGTAAVRRQMFQALDDDNDATALSLAKQIIDKVYVDIDAHRVAAQAYKALDDELSAAAEQDMAAGLIKSVMTGDGLSTKSAFTVITVQEEYAVMHSLGRNVIRQALVSDGGHSYDRLDTTSAASNTTSYYFVINRAPAAEANLLKPSQ